MVGVRLRVDDGHIDVIIGLDYHDEDHHGLTPDERRVESAVGGRCIGWCGCYSEWALGFFCGLITPMRELMTII
jgi:hypothetical protein